MARRRSLLYLILWWLFASPKPKRKVGRPRNNTSKPGLPGWKNYGTPKARYIGLTNRG